MATITHEAFEGRVRFEINPVRKLKAVLVEEAIEAAVPEALSFDPDSKAAILFSNFESFMAHTVAISFPLIEGKPELSAADAERVESLERFWHRRRQVPIEWRGMWEAFAEDLDMNTHNAWLKALNSSVDESLLAPPELRQGGDDDKNPKELPKSKK